MQADQETGVAVSSPATSSDEAVAGPSSKDKVKSDLRGKTLDEQDALLAPGDADVKQIEAVISKQRVDLTDEIWKVKTKRAGVESQIEEAKAAPPASDDASKEAQADALAKLEKEQAALTKTEEELEDDILENQADLETTKKPGTSKAELDKLAAKHGSSESSGAASERTVNKDGTSTVSTSSRGDGVSLEQKKTDLDDRGEEAHGVLGTAGYVGKTAMKGKDWGERDETTVVSGDTTASRTIEDKSHLGRDGYTKTDSDESTFKDGDYETSQKKESKTQVGLGGASRETSTSQKVGDHEISDTQKTGVTRGDGALGVTRESGHTDGIVDDKGKLVEGRETKTSLDGKATLNGNEVGLGGGAGAEQTTASKGNVKTGTSAHCGGNVSVQIVPAEKGDGYDLVIGVNLKGSVGASAGKGTDAGNIKGSVKASGSYTKTFTRHLADAEVATYLASLDSVKPGGGGSGKYQEFGVIAAAWQHGWSSDSVADLIAQAGDDPEALKRMQEGESNETVVKAGIAAEGSIGAKKGAFGGEIKVGDSADTTITNKFTDTGKGTDMEAEIDDSIGGSLGATGTFEGVSLGGEHGEKLLSGTGVKFSVPKDDPNYATIVARIKLCKTQEDIAQLKRDYPRLKASDTTLTGHETSNEAHMGFGGVEASITNDHGSSHKATVDKDGQRSDHYEGHATNGGKIKVGEDYSIGSSQKDSADLDVKETKDKDGKTQQTMSADFQTDTTESNLGQTLLDATDKKDKSIAQTALGGGEKVKVAEDTDKQGMFANDSDMNQLIGEADDPVAWQKHCCSGDRSDWIKLGAKIRAAKGDKKAISAAIAGFVDADASGRNEYIESVIRPAGTNKHGDMYEFPGSLASEKATFKRLVDGDPVPALQAAKDKDKADGMKKVQACLDELLHLEIAVSSKQMEFKDTARFGEMMRRIADRKQQVTKLLDLSERQNDTARYNELLGNCTRYKASEDKDYAEIESNFDGDHETDAIRNVALQNQLRALYLDWDPAYAELSALGFKWDFDKKIYQQFKPAHDRMDKLNKGKAPTEKTLEEENKEAADQREADAQSASAWEHSTFHVQAQAQAQANAKQAEKAKAVPAARARVNTAKMAAANAAGWHNFAMKQGKTVSPDAQALAGKGWTKWSLVNDDYTFENACKGDYADAAAVNRVADKKVADYHEVQALFDQGKAANHA